MFLFIDTEVDKSHERVWDWQLREICILVDDPITRFTMAELELQHGNNGVKFVYRNAFEPRQDMRGKDLAFDLAGCVEKLCEHSTAIVAHNVGHDCKVLQWVYNGFTRGRQVPWTSGTSPICTMEHSTAICKLGPVGGQYKWPSLMEAYCLLVDSKGFDGQHTARGDVQACRRLFYALLDLGAIPSLSQFRKGK